jgi:uncharacterized membrane protein
MNPGLRRRFVVSWSLGSISFALVAVVFVPWRFVARIFTQVSWLDAALVALAILCLISALCGG